MGAIVELRHLVILPRLISVGKKRRPLRVQSADGLRRDSNTRSLMDVLSESRDVTKEKQAGTVVPC